MIRFPEKVTDYLYRSSRPQNKSDLQSIYDLGIRTIISLEEGWGNLFTPYDTHDMWTDFLDMGGTLYNLKCSNILPPTHKQAETVHYNINQTTRRVSSRILIHCYSGVDRTGFMVAYHLAKQGLNPDFSWRANAWNKGMHKWYFWWRGYFMDYLK